jgi:ubiquitin C-terminal hydrolase
VGPTDFSPYFSNESPEREGKTSYSLRGIVDHHGGPRGGHYTAQCKDQAKDTWHLYDDETVHKLPSPMFGESTYMLFFER